MKSTTPKIVWIAPLCVAIVAALFLTFLLLSQGGASVAPTPSAKLRAPLAIKGDYPLMPVAEFDKAHQYTPVRDGWALGLIDIVDVKRCKVYYRFYEDKLALMNVDVPKYGSATGAYRDLLTGFTEKFGPPTKTETDNKGKSHHTWSDGANELELREQNVLDTDLVTVSLENVALAEKMRDQDSMKRDQEAKKRAKDL
jgi:hypothetical protein